MENVTESIVRLKLLFSWYDYALFTLMLGLSTLIGVWFGCVKRQATPNDYLLGGKKMKLIPISLSLIASNISGLTILGVPTDVYTYGCQYILHSITVLAVGFVTYFIYVPVFYKLQITSTYEYVELRFNSKLRVFGSLLFVTSTLLYLPIVVYIAALALSQATTLNVHWVTPMVCGVCIFYTTIGGLKAVVWTDALQFGVMVGSIVAVFYLGLRSAGGFGDVWTKASDGGRISFDFDWDPTKRDTFFTVSIGMFFNACGFMSINQGYIQKYLSLPSLIDIKWAVAYSVIGTSGFVAISVFTGLIMYSNYADCDPFTIGKLTRRDQILPYYVLDVSETIPGLAGLFISGLFSASLRFVIFYSTARKLATDFCSTLSSYLNCLSGMIYEDFILPFMPKDITENAASNILKLIVVIIGISATALVFVIEEMGNVLPVSFVLNGILMGPSLGIFTLGMLFPSANSKGAMIGTGASILIMTYIVIQAQIYQMKGFIKHVPKSISTDGCESSLNGTFFHKHEDTVQDTYEPFYLFRLSHYYYTALGALIMILIALPASLIFRNKNHSVSKDVICPLVHWTMKHERRHINYDSVDTTNIIPLDKIK